MSISAAGGVVHRHVDGAPEVLLEHRPEYDDWSLPKGKLHRGEAELLAAVREVAEETGAEVAVQQRLLSVHYKVDGTQKRVSYWSMRYVRGEFVPNEEVDQIAWHPVQAARELVSHSSDRRVLRDFASSPVADSVIVLVRHAKAGKRSEWQGEDALRPLESVGRRQAAELAEQLAVFVPTRISSADRTRCVQTVEPLAAALELQVTIEAAFADESYADGPGGTLATLLAHAKPGKVSVVCSQGLTIPSLIDQLAPRVRSSETRKGAYWVLSLVDGQVVAADPYAAP